MKTNNNKTLYSIIFSIFVAISITAQGSTSAPLNIDTEDNGDVHYVDEDSLIYPIYPPFIINTADTSNLSISPKRENQIKKDLNASMHFPKSYEIDTSCRVGEIPYSSGTNKYGAKTYNVPIEIYPGINGFQPALALSYNSQNTQANVGKGWSLSGISKIRRTIKNLYYDGVSGGVNLDRNDAFTLDGVRLLIKDSSDPYCILYESEQGNVLAKGHISDGIHKYFEVFYPNGEKGIFGYQESDSEGLEYPITTMTDIDGNRIEYIYTHTKNRYLIEKINYNGCSVEFSYVNRQNPTFYFTGGQKITESSLLQEIIVKIGLYAFRNYHLSYEYMDGIPLLSEIGCTQELAKYNPLKFLYGNSASPEYDTSLTCLLGYYNIQDTRNYKTARGRINNDLCEDCVLVYPNRHPYWYVLKNGDSKTCYYENKYPEDTRILVYSKLDDDIVMPMPNILTGKGFVDIFFANTEGGNEEAVVKVNNYVENGYDIIEFSVYKTLYGSSTLAKIYTRKYEWGKAHKDGRGNLSVYPKCFFTGDFNGDGKVEMMVTSTMYPFGNDSGLSYCRIIDLEEDNVLYNGRFMDFGYCFQGQGGAAWLLNEREVRNHSDPLMVMDYDGDGKTDICHITDKGIDIYTFDTSGDKLSPRKIGSDTVLNRMELINQDVFVTDLNGDGLMDILRTPCIDLDGREWYIYNSMGNGLFEKHLFNGPTYDSVDNGGILCQDINGDGIPDLIKFNDHGFSSHIAKNNSYVFTPEITVKEDKQILIPLNFHSQNSSTQLLGIKDEVITKYSYSNNVKLSTLLRWMVNSLGVVEINEYGLLSESSFAESLYTKGYGSVFPFVDILDPIPVLATSEKYLNGTAVDCHTYSYEEAVWHRHGMGFCGFKKIYDTNLRNHSYIRIFDPYNYSVLKNEYGLGYENNYTFNISVAKNKKVSIIPVTKIEKNLLHGKTESTTYKCDSFGNVTNEVIKFSDNSLIENSYTYTSQATAKDGYYIGFRRNHEKKTTSATGYVTESLSIPVFSKLKPLKEEKSINGKIVSTAEYIYGRFGSLVSKIINPYTSSLGLKTEYTYDKYGRVTTKTDSIGLCEYFKYDSTGRLYTHTDGRGATTTYNDDLTGAEFSIALPDSTLSYTRYCWDTSIPNSIYKITETHEGQPTVVKYYDALNREIRTSETGIDGDIKSTDFIYNSYGDLWMESLPYTGNTANFWNIYEYDFYGRISVQKATSGRTIKYTYGNGTNSVSVNDGQKSIQRTYDVFDNLSNISDPSGSVAYSWTPLNKPLLIDAYNGTKTNFTYDSYCRISNITDPSLGQLSYTYDSSGNVKTETNGNGDPTEFEYDSFNRLIKKSCRDLKTTYHYGQYGDLDSVCSDNGTSNRYEYDDIGRLIKSKETGLDGIWLEKQFQYSQGNIKSVKYTTQNGVLATECNTYSNGKLKEVKLDGITSIFKVESENEFGQPLEINTGLISRKYQYDAYGYPSRRIATVNDTKHQDFSYDFDPQTESLKWRSDNIRGLKEYFEYDNLNRLTKYDGNTASYDSRGNILSKSDIGAFEYSLPSKPYAISGADFTTEDISYINQDIAYSSFSRPLRITEGENAVSFSYNGFHERMKMIEESKGKVVKEKHYLGGCYETSETPNSSFIIENLYLLGDYYTSSVILSKRTPIATKLDTLKPSPGGKFNPLSISPDWPVKPPILLNNTTLHYVLRDYLGSITHIIDASGNLKQEISYDAWGRLRNPSTWDYYSPDDEPELMLGRGYTGHEHIQKCGIINMNARLYDPILGRFLSPDPFVQYADLGQNFNRYSYALNNPLYYTDEDGQFFWIAVGTAAVIGGAFNVWNNWSSITSHSGWSGVWQGAKYFLVGAAAGGIGAAAGMGVAVGFGSMLGATATSIAAASSSLTTSLLMKTTEGAIEGFMHGSFNAVVDGKDWKTALKDGAEEGTYGAIMSAATVGAQAIAPKTAKNYSVYYGYDKEGKVRYVGITSREPEVRFKEHLNSKNLDGSRTNRSYLSYDIIEYNKYTRKEARIWEQNKINKFGLMKNGGQLYNKRNEISRYLWNKYNIKY